VDAIFEAAAGGLKESLVLTDDSAPESFTYDLRLRPGLSVKPNPSNGLDLVEPSGRSRLSFLPPFMVDAAGATTGAVRFSATRNNSDWTLTVTPDADWLSDPDRQFPVILDPTVAMTDNYDCHIMGGAGADSNFCSQTNINVGYDGNAPSRALVKFSVNSAVPRNVTVLESYMRMYLRGTSSSTTTPISAHEVTEAWTNGATWNTRDGVNSWSPGGAFEPSAGDTSTDPVTTTAGWKYWYLTQLTQGWADGSIDNNGLLLKQPSENVSNVYSFDSLEASSGRPVLEVLYWKWAGDRDMWTYESQRLSDRSQLDVNVANGNLQVHADDLEINGTGLDLDLERTYNNLLGVAWSYGRSWVGGPLDLWLDADGDFPDGSAAFHGDGGYAVPFIKKPDGSFASPSGIDASLVKNADATHTLKYHRSGVRLNFADPSEWGELQSIVDRNGNQLTLNYDASGGNTSVVDTQGRTTTFTYNTKYFITSVTDPAGRQYAYTYSGNLLTGYTDPAGRTTNYAYNTAKDLIQITTPEGAVTNLTYDSARRVTAITRVTDAATGNGPTTRFAYAPPGSDPLQDPNQAGTTTVTDPNGDQTTYTYDFMGRVTKVTDALGNATSSTYTSNSNVETYTDASASRTMLNYDTNNNLVRVETPTGSATTYGYNDATDPFLPTSQTDAQNNTQDLTYDTKGNLISVRNGLASANEFRYSYNTDGTLSTITDSKGNVTTHSYDVKGNLTLITPPAPLGATSFTYDDASRIATMIDGKGQRTAYAYDPLDRLTTITYADDSTITYGYDAIGNLLTRTDDTGTTTFDYDPLNRMTTKTLPGNASITYTYDPNGNLTSVTDGGGTVSYGYDAVNNITSVTEPAGTTTAFSYDENYRRTSTAYPNGVTQRGTYDASGRMRTIAATNSSGTTLTSFTYDYANLSTDGDTALRQSVTDAAGVKTTYRYDSLNRLTTADLSGTAGVDYSYVYDGNSNMTSKSISGATTSYSYNAANQLTQAGSTTYSYDGGGNLTGNSLGMALTYNAKDQTTSITPPGGSTVPMAYADATQDERVSAGGMSFIAGLLGVQSEKTATASTYYTRDPRGALVSQRGSSGTHYYLFDGLGSVVGLTDSSGSLRATYEYDPYGHLVSSTGTVANPWRFAGGYFDSASGLNKFGTRYYDSAVARWTQRDPAGPASPPDYTYAADDPINFADPDGRVPTDASGNTRRSCGIDDPHCSGAPLGGGGSICNHPAVSFFSAASIPGFVVTSASAGSQFWLRKVTNVVVRNGVASATKAFGWATALATAVDVGCGGL